MRLAVFAVGHRQPDWVTAGCAEYLKRMPRELPASVAEMLTPVAITFDARARRPVGLSSRPIDRAVVPVALVIRLRPVP